MLTLAAFRRWRWWSAAPNRTGSKCKSQTCVIASTVACASALGSGIYPRICRWTDALHRIRYRLRRQLSPKEPKLVATPQIDRRRNADARPSGDNDRCNIFSPSTGMPSRTSTGAAGADREHFATIGEIATDRMAPYPLTRLPFGACIAAACAGAARSYPVPAARGLGSRCPMPLSTALLHGMLRRARLCSVEARQLCAYSRRTPCSQPLLCLAEPRGRLFQRFPPPSKCTGFETPD